MTAEVSPQSALPKWLPAIWALWIAAVLALAARPFARNLGLFRQVQPALYLAMLAALGAGVAAAVGYHFLRRGGFWRWEPIALPIFFVLLCAVYSPGGVAVVLWMLAAAYATGRFATGFMGIPADLALSTLAGFGIFSLLLFVLGLCHAFYTWVFVLLFALPLLLLWRQGRGLADELLSMRTAWLNDPDMRAPQVSVAVFGTAVLALITAATALTPAWNGDTVQFHLPLIRVFLSAHSLAVPRAIPYGNFPQGFEVLAGVAYALAGQTAAQLVNPALFCIAMLVLYRIARSCGISLSWAIGGAALAVSIPFVHWTGSVLKNDLSLAAYQLAALLCYLRWRETRVFRWMLLSAFFVAMSFGIKYVAIFGTLPLALAAAAGLWREPKRFRRMASLAAILLLFGCIWSVRAYVNTGDPFAPAGADRAVRRRNHAGSRALNRILRSFYDIHFEGKTNFQSPTENPMGIALLLLAPLWLIPRARQTSWRTEAVLWLYVLLYYPPWAYEMSILRYAVAPVVLLAMLGAARLALLPRALVIAAMGAVFVFSLPVVILMEMAPAQIPFLARRIDAATFLRRTLAPYGAVEFLSRHAAPSDPIASIGDWASAYTPNPANFHLTYLNGRKYSPAYVNRILHPGDRYLILPRHPNLAELEAAAREHHTLSRLYQDQDFVVDGVSDQQP